MRGKKALCREINGIIKKQCTECCEWFPNTGEYFYKDKKAPDGLKCVCIICKAEDTKIYYERIKDNNEYKAKRKENNKQYSINNKEKLREQRKKDKDKAKNTELKRKYGITLNDYNLMIENQNNKCAICGRELKTGVGGRSIDHCHITGVVRGILCITCNTTLGFYKENIETFQTMITYLELHTESGITV